MAILRFPISERAIRVPEPCAFRVLGEAHANDFRSQARRLPKERDDFELLALNRAAVNGLPGNHFFPARNRAPLTPLDHFVMAWDSTSKRGYPVAHSGPLGIRKAERLERSFEARRLQQAHFLHSVTECISA